MKPSKATVLVLIIILTVSFTVAINTARGENPKPSVPEFMIKLVAHPYDVKPTYTTDPYTGKTIVTQEGYHVENKSILVIIKNQHFTPSTNNYLFYNVSLKGHYAQDWTYYPSGYYSRDSSAATCIPQSTSDETIVTFDAPSEGEMDFRVQAQIGYYTSHSEGAGIPGAPFTVYTFHGKVSGWSNTQTLSVDDESIVPSSSPSPSPQRTPLSPSPTQNPTATPTQPDTQTSAEFKVDWEHVALFIMAAVIAGLVVVVAVLWRRTAAK